jgi:hypothetical protein
MFRFDSLWLILLYLLLAILLRARIRNLATAILVVVMFVAVVGAILRDYHREISNAWETARATAINWRTEATWPPRLGEQYPDLLLYDQEGNVTRLSSFKDKMILIEFVGTSCPACVALSGGNLYGGFEGIEPQADLESIDRYLKHFGHVDLSDPRLVFVQILLFDPKMQPPTVADAARWAEHFQLKRSQNQIVLVGDARLATDANRALVPGFHLIDRDFILRADSTGPSPPHDLYQDLIPMLGDFLESE